MRLACCSSSGSARVPISSRRSRDVHSDRIVGYSISDRMTAKLGVHALPNAVTRRREVAGCILHADRGSQFRSRAPASELRRHDMVGSMGRVGAAGDNAAVESFWFLVQTNVLKQQRWTTRQELRLVIVVWIERKYHRQRAQDALCGLTPIEFEAKLTEQPLSLAGKTIPVTDPYFTPMRRVRSTPCVYVSRCTKK
ncbi:Integrase core domain-containing protein [Leifsonia sp. CL147]|nr:Integrase core domain-containing protein [Leifsonia sp. CL154]SFL60404.1 Integrase core domain-containing protein [Leifsonia sp. CL147]